MKSSPQIHHENLVGFVGAIIEPQTVTILSAYCARGSLEDVLANEDLRLDQMFVASLVNDLLRGLCYLHDSCGRSHGRLRSSNCLVDARWVCQIGDFGLEALRSGAAAAHGGENNRRRRRRQRQAALWRAPELLRDAAAPLHGTPKADVYAFGIVLYEICGRSGPWGKTELTVDGKNRFILLVDTRYS